MNSDHKGEDVIVEEIASAEEQIAVGANYWHYKDQNKLYQVIGFGVAEANDELCVIYQAQYGQKLTFIRPLTSWLENVAWQNSSVPRFTKV